MAAPEIVISVEITDWRDVPHDAVEFRRALLRGIAADAIRKVEVSADAYDLVAKATVEIRGGSDAESDD